MQVLGEQVFGRYLSGRYFGPVVRQQNDRRGAARVLGVFVRVHVIFDVLNSVEAVTTLETAARLVLELVVQAFSFEALGELPVELLELVEHVLSLLRAERLALGTLEQRKTFSPADLERIRNTCANISSSTVKQTTSSGQSLFSIAEKHCVNQGLEWTFND